MFRNAFKTLSKEAAEHKPSAPGTSTAVPPVEDRGPRLPRIPLDKLIAAAGVAIFVYAILHTLH